MQLAISLGTLGYYCNGITDELYITICCIWWGPFFALTLYTSAVYYKECISVLKRSLGAKTHLKTNWGADNSYRDIAVMSMYMLPSICGPLEHTRKSSVRIIGF